MTNDNQKSVQWACQYLSSQGYGLQSENPELVQTTPWSYVVRFYTSKGYVYLKRTPKLLALELPVFQILHQQFQSPVPEVIVGNQLLHCFLVKDAGERLREILKAHFDISLYSRAIDEFTRLQLVVASRVELLLETGVPDWRLNNLPDLFKQLLLKSNILIEDGLTKDELNDLNKLCPIISDLCARLSAYTIPESLVQPDFHDNNLLIDRLSQKITIIDLGEIVIAHPFFSLINCLKQAIIHHGFKEGDKLYSQLEYACFKNYYAFESKENIFEALSLAKSLWPLYSALAQYRLIAACGREELMNFQRQGNLSRSLKNLLENTQTGR